MTLATRIRIAIIAVVIIAVPLAAYLTDRSATSELVARNVTVGGVPVGGMNSADATLAISSFEDALRSEVGVFTVNGREFRLTPASVELDVDVPGAVALAMAARRDGNFFENFASWVASLTSTEEIPLPVAFDEDVIHEELDIWETIAVEDRAFAGSVSVVDGEVVAEYPREGRAIDRTAGVETIERAMTELESGSVPIPVVNAISSLTPNQFDEAAAEMESMIDDPIVLRSNDITFRMTFSPEDLAEAVRATIEPRADTIEIAFDREAVLEIIEPLRPEFEISPVDARFDIDLNTGEYTVIPGRSGTVLDIEQLLIEMQQAALGDGTGTFPIEVGARPTLTTEEAMAFTTMTKLGGFSTKYTAGEPRTKNIQRMADEVDGAVVLPGEVFSINEHVGLRTEDNGYVNAPAIINGAPYCCDNPANMGGGVSQFATTLFNASFFSCLEDVEHQPHSLWFPRYPRGREATLGFPGPDLKFRNDTDWPIVIRSWYGSESVSVRIYGDNGGLTCEADTHDKEAITEFEVEYQANPDLAPGDRRRVRGGKNGFLQRVDRIVTYPDGTQSEDMNLIWRYRPLSELWEVNPCEVTGEPVNCAFALPSVVGMTSQDATAALRQRGIGVIQKWEAVTDPSKNNIVLRQSPAAGQPVRAGSTVTLTLGSFVEGG